MKTLTRSLLVAFVAVGFAAALYGGPEPMAESKQVMPPPAPDCCQWAGFYVGAHVGGQFGDSSDHANFDNELRFGWSYDESGIVAGGQAGYNVQWHSIVLGPEFDLGYMNLQGSGLSSINTPSFRNLFLGETSSDFYITLRGRVGYAHDCWLFYVTGGGIGVNYDTRTTFIPEPAEFSGHKEDFDWGYCVGGGIERKIGCHWSIKLEYLYFNLERQDFNGDLLRTDGNTSAILGTNGDGKGSEFFHWSGDTDGHIVRAGLNYHF